MEPGPQGESLAGDRGLEYALSKSNLDAAFRQAKPAVSKFVKLSYLFRRDPDDIFTSAWQLKEDDIPCPSPAIVLAEVLAYSLWDSQSRATWEEYGNTLGILPELASVRTASVRFGSIVSESALSAFYEFQISFEGVLDQCFQFGRFADRLASLLQPQASQERERPRMLCYYVLSDCWFSGEPFKRKATVNLERLPDEDKFLLADEDLKGKAKRVQTAELVQWLARVFDVFDFAHLESELTIDFMRAARARLNEGRVLANRPEPAKTSDSWPDDKMVSCSEAVAELSGLGYYVNMARISKEVRKETDGKGPCPFRWEKVGPNRLNVEWNSLRKWAISVNEAAKKENEEFGSTEEQRLLIEATIKGQKEQRKLLRDLH